MSNMAVAYAMKKRKKMAKGGPTPDMEKGVHKPMIGKPGTSYAGQESQNPQDPERHAAKAKHMAILEEIRSMKKPELMAEGGEPAYKSEYGVKDLGQEGVHHQAGRLPKGQSDMGRSVRRGDYEGAKRVAWDKITEQRPVGHRTRTELMAEGGCVSEGCPGCESCLSDSDPVVMKVMMGRAKGYSEGGKVANSDEIEAGFMPNEFDDLHLRDDLEEHYTGANSGDELGDEQEDEDRADIVKRIMKSRAKKDRMPNPA